MLVSVNNGDLINHHGACLCGSVQFSVRGDPIVVAHCHCTDCQKQSGAGHATGAMYLRNEFAYSGDIKTYNLNSDNDHKVSRVFCPECASLIFSHNDKLAQYVTIPLGIFEDSDAFVPEVSIFARNRKSWDFMDKKIQMFATQPDWEPEN